MPGLDERREDIPELAAHFVKQAVRKYLGAEFTTEALPEILPEAMDVLKEYEWPGNVRQLENVIGGTVDRAWKKIAIAIKEGCKRVIRARHVLWALGAEDLDDASADELAVARGDLSGSGNPEVRKNGNPEVRKSGSDGIRKPGSPEAKLHEVDQGITSSGALTASEATAAGIPAEDRYWLVCELVYRGRLGSPEVASERGVTERTARTWLSALVEAGIAMRVGRGPSTRYVPASASA